MKNPVRDDHGVSDLKNRKPSVMPARLRSRQNCYANKLFGREKN